VDPAGGKRLRALNPPGYRRKTRNGGPRCTWMLPGMRARSPRSTTTKWIRVSAAGAPQHDRRDSASRPGRRCYAVPPAHRLCRRDARVRKKLSHRSREAAITGSVAMEVLAPCRSPDPERDRARHGIMRTRSRMSNGFWKRFGPAAFSPPGKRLQGLALTPGIPGLDGDCHQCFTPGERRILVTLAAQQTVPQHQ
jgi:hypothetical protein